MRRSVAIVGYWEELPADAPDQCAVLKLGWALSVRSDDPERCPNKATKIKRETCGCGSCDMTIRVCDTHFKDFRK